MIVKVHTNEIDDSNNQTVAELIPSVFLLLFLTKSLN